MLLLVLSTVTVAIYWGGKDPNSSSVDKTMFRVEDLQSVNEVTLESDTNKVDLKYAGSRWVVNGQYAADRQLAQRFRMPSWYLRLRTGLTSVAVLCLAFALIHLARG